MGMDQKVTFTGAGVPVWDAVAGLLTERGFATQMRMIDGELAFPEERPPDAWRELRVGTPQGMVTLRRDEDGIALVTWGNADPALRQAWNALTWACAQVTGGRIRTAEGEVTADKFAQSAELPESWQC